MPRPKTIIVNDAAVLAAIQTAWEADRAALESEIAAAKREYRRDRSYAAWSVLCGLERELEAITAVGIKSDLARFAGRALTPSERIRWQEAVRRLAAAGRVVRTGNSIRPADPQEGPTDV